MSFDILLGTNTSELNQLVKSVTPGVKLTGTLRNQTTVLEPTIIISGDISAICKYNYMEIPVFSRKYFITNAKAIRNGIVEISARVDVLSTYAEAIKNQTAIVRKQRDKWNLYLNDGTFHVYQNPNVVTAPFPSGFSGLDFVLAVAGS